MSEETLKDAVRLATRAGMVWIASADPAGVPHLSAASKLAACRNNYVTVKEWFCPWMVANLESNRSVSLVVWWRDSEEGYQLLGTVDRITEAGVLNGFSLEAEAAKPQPQVERELRIHVDKILKFRPGPHSDTEE